ncbi:hypothetical protein G9A89_016883 [Geosiphon pyriformis]|nr:hypothetical protein G9A89_016883 [Geosiphon pyriformis]
MIPKTQRTIPKETGKKFKNIGTRFYSGRTKKWEKPWKEFTAARIQSEIIDKGITVPALFLSLEELLAPCKKTRTKKTVQRPQNDYVIYRKEVQAEILAAHPDTPFIEISRITSVKWEKETQEKRNFFTLLAAIGNLIHNDVFPDYQYKPTNKKTIPRSHMGPDKEAQPWELSASMPHVWTPDNGHFKLNDEHSQKVQEPIKQELVNYEAKTLAQVKDPSRDNSQLLSSFRPLLPSKDSAFHLVKPQVDRSARNFPFFYPYFTIRKIVPVKILSSFPEQFFDNRPKTSSNDEFPNALHMLADFAINDAQKSGFNQK